MDGAVQCTAYLGTPQAWLVEDNKLNLSLCPDNVPRPPWTSAASGLNDQLLQLCHSCCHALPFRTDEAVEEHHVMRPF